MTNAHTQIPIFRACSWKKNLRIKHEQSKHIYRGWSLDRYIGELSWITLADNELQWTRHCLEQGWQTKSWKVTWTSPRKEPEDVRNVEWMGLQWDRQRRASIVKQTTKKDYTKTLPERERPTLSVDVGQYAAMGTTNGTPQAELKSGMIAQKAITKRTLCFLPQDHYN